MGQLKNIITVMALSIALGACNEISTQKMPDVNKDTKIITSSPTTVKSAPAGKKVAFKKIEVMVEGQKEMRDANINVSDLGYDIYVLDGFKFSSEEPNKDIIFSNYDNEFFVRIEKLDDKVNFGTFKETQKKGLESVGKVTEIDPSTLFLDKFKDSKFSFLVETKNKTNIMYVVKEFDGKPFAFTINMPLKEAAEGITPSLWAMIATISPKI